MTWGDLNNTSLTWSEVETLKWLDFADSEYKILLKHLHGEISLTPQAELRLLSIFKPIVDEYQNQYGEKISISDYLDTIATSLNLFLKFRDLYPLIAPPLKEAIGLIIEALKT